MTIWKEMSNSNRIGLLVGSVIVLLFLVLISVWLMRDRYAVLFSELEESDAASIVKELDKMKVDYQLQADSGNILVPAELVHKTRLQLMSSGAPLSGGVGFEIFDDSDFGMTEFSQKINFQRALQGELTRTIMSLGEVRRARVHLVMAEHGLFKRDSSGPSASVTLFLKSGAILTESQIIGIQRLIAAAVPDLMVEQVNISDQNGVTLNHLVPNDDSVDAVSSRLQQKKAVEDYLSEKAKAVLSSAIGDSEVTISIDVDLDFSHVKKTQEDVLPSGEANAAGMLRRRESKSDQGSLTTADKGRFTTEVDYQLGRSVAQTVEMPGKILRMNIAVVVPDILSDVNQVSIRELVSVAVGFNKERGDAIAIYSSTATGLSTEASMNDEASSAAVATKQSKNFGKDNKENGQLVLQLLNHFFSTAEKKVIAVGVLVSFVLFFIFLIYWAFKKKAMTTDCQRLSEQQRDDILIQLNTWLNADGDKKDLSEVNA